MVRLDGVRNDNYFGTLTTITIPHGGRGFPGVDEVGGEAFPLPRSQTSDGARSRL